MSDNLKELEQRCDEATANMRRIVSDIGSKHSAETEGCRPQHIVPHTFVKSGRLMSRRALYDAKQEYNILRFEVETVLVKIRNVSEKTQLRLRSDFMLPGMLFAYLMRGFAQALSVAHYTPMKDRDI